MARLRKPSLQTLPVPLPAFAKPLSELEPTARSTRSSPRKPSHALSSKDEDEGLAELVPKLTSKSRVAPVKMKALGAGDIDGAVEKPKLRKQRVLKPLEGNSVLLGGFGGGLAEKKREKGKERLEMDGIEKNFTSMDGGVLRRFADVKKHRRIDMVVQDVKKSVAKEVEVLEEGVREGETSILGGDESVKQKEGSAGENEEDDQDEDEEDFGPVVAVRPRQRQRYIRHMDSESGSEYESASGSENEASAVKPVPILRTVSAPGPQPDTWAYREENQLFTNLRPISQKNHSAVSDWAEEVIDLTSSPELPPSFALPSPRHAQDSSNVPSRPQTSDSDTPFAMLSYSPTPPRLRSPIKAPPLSRPSTPPLPPQSPSRLVSPSKKEQIWRPRIELRPSLDAFWEPDAVHPSGNADDVGKPLVSPRKIKWREDIVKMMEGVALKDDSDLDSDNLFPSPTTSPRKKSTTPAKRQRAPRSNPTKQSTSEILVSPSAKEVRAKRKAFAAYKHAFATSFITELDTTICAGQIATLSAPTGGIKLLWSKSLKTTAGRATWRREQIRLRTGLGTTDFQVEVRHHASIELAEKVIDDEERLCNVLAHEFCHLAVFMIDGVRDRPHGAEFKAWGKKVGNAFMNRGVVVTTKHSYEIEYKFVWECVSCGLSFKRHSRSVDPKRHSCGRCKGRLVQIKPVPRVGFGAGAGGDGNGEDEAGKEKEEGKGKLVYQLFVKENFTRVKKELERKGKDAGMGKVMAVLGEEYRARKEAKEVKIGQSAKAIDTLGEELGTLRV